MRKSRIHSKIKIENSLSHCDALFCVVLTSSEFPRKIRVISNLEYVSYAYALPGMHSTCSTCTLYIFVILVLGVLGVSDSGAGTVNCTTTVIAVSADTVGIITFFSGFLSVHQLHP